MLHPCDLHVLTTPPAFRLSQDQTLQLFFLDRIDPPAHRVTLRRRAGLNGFSMRVILEEEFVHRPTSDEVDRLLLPHRRLRQQGQSNLLQHAGQARRLKEIRCKAQNIFWPFRARTRNDFLLKSMTFRRCYPPEGSLTCVHREDVLRYLTRMLFDDIRLCPIRWPPKRLTTGLTSSR